MLEEIDAATGHEGGWALARLCRLFDAPPYKPHRIVIAAADQMVGREASSGSSCGSNRTGASP
ncbi:hypothetical protein BH23GEM8_BH23GEM8_07100 [soil metagenome]